LGPQDEYHGGLGVIKLEEGEDIDRGEEQRDPLGWRRNVIVAVTTGWGKDTRFVSSDQRRTRTRRRRRTRSIDE